MKNSTLFSMETSFKDSFYCCCESLKGNFKFLLVFALFMASFTQGVSAQGTLVPSCNLIGPLEACAVLNPADTSGDFIINIEVARSGAPDFTGPLPPGVPRLNFNNNFAYSFVTNSSGAFIRSYGTVNYNVTTNKTTQALTVCPGTGTPEFNLQLLVTNKTSSPWTFCECSKSVSVSKVAATSSYLPIACYGQLSTLTAVGQFSDIGQYTYTLLPNAAFPAGVQNTTGVFPGLPGSEAGITYTVVVTSAELCETSTSQTIIQPAYNPVLITCPQPGTISACQSTEAINTAFNAWLNSFNYTGGTNSSVTRSPLQPTVPALCGGSTTVTWTVRDECGEPQTCTSTFTITPAPAVTITQPESSSTNACLYADQDAANAAFTAWLAQFTVSGGCAPVGNYGQPQAPAYCGGSTIVVYTVTDRCYQTSTRTATFTITPAPAVVITQAQSATSNACLYADQAAANAAFAAWLNGFSVSGGCAPVGSFGEGRPTAPAYCGGATTVTYTVTDNCYQTSSRTATFTITPAPAVVVNVPENSTSNACSYADQDAANAAYDAWIASFTVSGGCAPVGGFTNEQTAPEYCGGTRTVTYVVVDKCYQSTQYTRTFTITPAPAVVITQAQSATSNACSYADQAAANAAFAAWLNGFSVSGGCAPVGSFGEGTPSAPAYCGGETTVTYGVSDKCYDTTRYTATFTITPAPAVVVNTPENSTSNACSYADQDAANAAYDAWIASFSVSGGCAPVGGFTNEQTAPAYCGGTRTVTYVVVDKCYQSTQYTRTFTITPAPAVVITQAESATSNACSYAGQAAADAAFTAWLNGFSVSGGCAPVGSFGEGRPTAPAYCGGETTVTYTVADKCYQTSTRTATFTITPAPLVVVNTPSDLSSNACSYADQAAADAAYDAWIASFSVSGGCAPVGGFTNEQTAPAYCGGTRTVTYVVVDKCYQSTQYTRTFTITSAPAVVVNGPQSTSSNACSYADQAAADAAFAAWLNGFSVSGGCAPVGSYGEGRPTAPAYCGGTTSVTYTVSDKCYQGASITRTFVITPAPEVVVNVPENSTSNACSYADQAAADAAYNAWINSFSVSGGCAPVGGFTNEQTAPAYCGGTRTVTYVVVDKCYQSTQYTRTFTITGAPAVVVTTAQDSTSNACSYADQAAANAAFTAWLAQFSVSGGCAPVGSYGQPAAPAYCGGTVTVTYTVTDKCYETSTQTATFTITPAPAVVVNGPANTTAPAGSYADQAAADAAFAAWLAQFSVSGGCAPSGSYGQPQAPYYCGGTVEVTYTVTDKCYETTSITRTFTITPANPPVVNTPENTTSNACIYADQAAADAAFAAWLAQFTVSGGISPIGSFGEGTPSAPQYCGGTTTVTYTVTDRCYEPIVITRTFTITPAPAVVVNGPENSTSNACSYADQAAADAAFTAWLNGFSVNGGCAPTGVLSILGGSPTAPITAPAYCGGTVSVSYSVIDKCYQGSFIVRTFTITPAPAVVVNGSENSTSNACSYADQAAADAAFAAWLNGFSVSGGCAPTGSFGEGTPSAPAYCGGTTSVTYTVADKCYEGSTRTATFTITPAPAVVVNTPENSTSNACSYADQAAADAAYNAWINSFTVSGGCAPIGAFTNEQSAPEYCGGTRTVTYVVVDKCYQSTQYTRTFTITPAPAVVVNGSENSTSNACTYAGQAAADAAFAAWLNGFSVTGGCAPVGSFGEGTPSAPAYCGGTTSVTYTVSDKCYQGTSITRTFTITPAPAVVVNGSENSTSNACSYADQAAADAAYQAWLNGFSVSGGCAPVGAFASEQTAPAYCGGTRTVTYVVADKCYQGTSITRTFTITPAPAVVVNGSEDNRSNACSYADQAAADAAFAAWLNGFSVSGGCAPVGSFGEGTPSAPAYCGGTTSVTYTVSDKCYEGTSITRTFTITPAPAVVVNGSENSTSNACSYADQAAADAAYAAWLNGFSVSGGCAPVGSFGEGTPSAPAYCGGTTSVTYTVSDKCYQGSTRTATFTITPAPAVVVNGSENFTSNACSYANQAAANAAFATWLAGFNVSGGCAPVGSFGEGTPSAPAYCGGTTTVTYTATDRCYQGTPITRTFTIGTAPAVVFNCGNDVTVPACSTQAQVNAAFATFLASTTASGGCNGSLTRTQATAPSNCGGSVNVTWTYASGCAETQSCTRTFTVATPAPAVISCGNNVTLPACSTQAQLNAAWTAFLNSTTATGGCGGVLTRTSCSAPSLCGGYVDVTWTYTVASCGPQSGCGNTNSIQCTRRFTVAAPAPAVISCGNNVTLPACSTQAELNAAWTAFLNSTTASGGCNGVLTRTSCSAPSLCGGYVDVTWKYTVSTCGQQSGCGNTNYVTCTRRFTVTAPAQVAIRCASNVTVPACSTQAQVDTAWAAFLASTTASGGCGGVLTNNGGSAPSACGGYKDVTWTYRVGSCGQQSGCGSTNTVTCTKRFTVQAPSQVVFNCGTNVTVGACKTQAQVNSAWTAFLNSTTASGGCGGVLTNNAPSQAPSLCGGSVSVTWTYTVASCGQQSGCGNTNQMTCTRTFTVTPTTPVVFNCGNNVTVPACSSQTQVNTAWNAFLASTTASGGCNGVFSRTSATTPSSCGGSVDVTWTYTTTACGGQSSTQTCTRTFTVAAPAPVVLTAGANVTLPACSTQAQLNTAWTAFLNSTTGTGGCGGRLTRTSCYAPSLCGGYVDVTWTYTVDTCGQSSGCGSSNSGTQSQSITRRFTVATPAPLTFNAGNNVTVPACSTQAQLNTAWTAFLNSTTVTGGCNATLTRTSCNAPSLCGGYVDVTWTATTASCGQQSGCGTSNSKSITRRFTVSAPQQVSFNCGSNVTLSGSATQAQIAAAWNNFLNSTTASGGCGAVLTRTSASMPTECGEYADVTWTYTVASCGAQSGCGNTNQLTCTKRFSISGSSATINAGSNVTLASCKTQAQVNAAWTTFINSTTVTGGSGTLTNNASSCTIPSACGGYADVTWTYRSNCGQTTVTCGGQTTTGTTYTVTRRFTVQSGGGVNVSGPSSVSYVNTHFNSQYAVNNAFAAWLCQFTTVSNGCGSTAVFSGSPRVAPSWTNGGTVSVTYSITGNCNSDTVCASFTITRGAVCKIEPATATVATTPMTVKAYPNPFSENFNLDLTTSSVEKVGVTIYDMTGKLIEQREVNADEVSGLQAGSNLPSGVYNVIVSQGSEVKTLRVIKR
ncbi:MAG: T9SS type A sorting domain-containing protein [Flavobacterium sp. JAD_PAG50586_2]|nr:MAG: T9SS type A sorting domain-containing protein [Flavobacterium sp. JAD_PAG50586_2]